MSIVGDKVVQSIHIAAPRETVFRYFTEPERLVRWFGREATLEPRTGGIYRCVVNDTSTVLGEFLEVDPPQRVVFSWGFEGNELVPPGSSIVAVNLQQSGSGTDVILVHSGLPHPMLKPHDKGWRGYLDTLKRATASMTG